MSLVDLDPTQTLPKKSRLGTWDCLAIAILALLVSAIMFFSTFHGEDEVMTLRVVSRIVAGLRTGDARSIAMVMGADYHPPLRNLIPVPFVAALGPTLIAVRLPSILVWAASCILTGVIAARLSASRRVGLVTGLLVALSGLFQLEAMAIGHGYLTFIGLVLILHLLNNPPAPLLTKVDERAFIITSLILLAGFLCFTTFALVTAALYAAYLVQALRSAAAERRRAVWRLLVLALPFAAIYVAYYAIFLGVPLYMVKRGYVEAPFGQLHQNLVRSRMAHFNVQAFRENIGTTGYYTLPIIGPALVGVGLLGMLQRAPALFAAMTAYGAVSCFYMFGNTSQHFLSLAIWSLPFAAAALHNVDQRSGHSLKLAAGGLAALLAVWTLALHAWPYAEDAYPERIARASLGDGLWRNNALLPIGSIRKEIGADSGLVASINGGAYEAYYFPELSWARHPKVELGADRCLDAIVAEDGRRAKTIIASRATKPCDPGRATHTPVPGSTVAIIRFGE